MRSTSQSSASRRCRTLVYPIGGGEAVSYADSEVDEVDREGCLRVAATNAATPTVDGAPVYVIWAPGSWQRAETVVDLGESSTGG